jgi:hypothetical protein
MEDESESEKIEVYGNLSTETYNEQQRLLYLVGKYS